MEVVAASSWRLKIQSSQMNITVLSSWFNISNVTACQRAVKDFFIKRANAIMQGNILNNQSSRCYRWALSISLVCYTPCLIAGGHLTYFWNFAPPVSFCKKCDFIKINIFWTSPLLSSTNPLYPPQIKFSEKLNLKYALSKYTLGSPHLVTYWI